MREEAASAGFYESLGWHTKSPRIQLLTVRELLDGRTLAYLHVTGRTCCRAPRAEEPAADQLPLDLT